MNTFCCCFSLRSGTILIALISIICSLPFVNVIFQFWNNPELPSPRPARKDVLIKCSLNESVSFEFFVPAVMSIELGNIIVVTYFFCSLLLLHGALMRKQVTCLPWLWLTSLCFFIHFWTAIVVLVQAMFSRSCHLSSELHRLVGVLLIYLFEVHLISTIDSFCEQLGREIRMTDQSDQQNFINNVNPTVQPPNHTIVPPATNPHLQTVPEVVIYPNPHLDLPPAYDEVIRPTAPPPD